MNQFMNPMQNQNFQNPYLSRMSPQPQNGINWVQGIEGAKAWYLQPNSNVMLLDSENDGVFYIKVSDNVGMCTLRTFTFTETTQVPQSSTAPEIDLSEYVKKSELESLIKSMLGGQNEQSVSAIKPKSNAKQSS